MKTIVNLRGDNPEAPWQLLESRACRRNAISLIIARPLSRAAPSKELLHELKDIIMRMELPALAHCKSGADRVGLFCVMYRHLRLGHPIEESLRELDWTYGHFKSAKTGILDCFFESYLRQRKAGQSLMDWIDYDYVPETLMKEFRPQAWSRFIVDLILRRE